jgi:hypothetical protein
MPHTKPAQLSPRRFLLALVALSRLAAGARAKRSRPLRLESRAAFVVSGARVNPARLLPARGANLHGARVAPGRAGTFERVGRTARERRMFEWTRDRLKLRREHAVMRPGRLIDLVSDEDVYAFAREIDDETIVLAFNRAATPKQVAFPAAFINVTSPQLLVSLTKKANLLAGAVRENDAGTNTFLVPARTAVAFEARTLTTGDTRE